MSTASAVSQATSIRNFNLFVREVDVDGFVQVRGPRESFDFAFICNVSWSDGRSRFIKRTYSDFLTLKNALLKVYRNDFQLIGRRYTPALPGKPFFRRNTPELAEGQELLVQRFLKQLLELPDAISRSSLITNFLESRPTDPRPSSVTIVTPEDSPIDESRHHQNEFEDELFYDCDIAQIMLGAGGAPQIGAAESCDNFWCLENDSFSNILQRAGSEPVLCGEPLIDNDDEDGYIDLDSDIFPEHRITTESEIDAALERLSSLRTSQSQSPRSPVINASSHSDSQRPKHPYEMKRSKSLFASYSQRLAEVQEHDYLSGADVDSDQEIQKKQSIINPDQQQQHDHYSRQRETTAAASSTEDVPDDDVDDGFGEEIRSTSSDYTDLNVSAEITKRQSLSEQNIKRRHAEGDERPPKTKLSQSDSNLTFLAGGVCLPTHQLGEYEVVYTNGNIFDEAEIDPRVSGLDSGVGGDMFFESPA